MSGLIIIIIDYSHFRIIENEVQRWSTTCPRLPVYQVPESSFKSDLKGNGQGVKQRNRTCQLHSEEIPGWIWGLSKGEKPCEPFLWGKGSSQVELSWAMLPPALIHIPQHSRAGIGTIYPCAEMATCYSYTHSSLPPDNWTAILSGHMIRIKTTLPSLFWSLVSPWLCSGQCGIKDVKWAVCQLETLTWSSVSFSSPSLSPPDVWLGI